MGVNGRRFLYDGSMGMYHRGPLSPRWKTVTQKPEVAFVLFSLLPPPSSPVSQPPSRCASVGAAVQVGLGDGWTSSNLTAAISVTAKKRSNNRGEVEIKLGFVWVVCSSLLGGSDITAGHTSLSSQFISEAHFCRVHDVPASSVTVPISDREIT